MERSTENGCNFYSNGSYLHDQNLNSCGSCVAVSKSNHPKQGGRDHHNSGQTAQENTERPTLKGNSCSVRTTLYRSRLKTNGDATCTCTILHRAGGDITLPLPLKTNGGRYQHMHRLHRAGGDRRQLTSDRRPLTTYCQQNQNHEIKLCSA